MKKMEHRKQADNVEHRYLTEGIEYRAATAEKPAEIFGYALRFSSEYRMYDRNIGEFYEKVDRSALQGADMSDVRILGNHESSYLLARTSAGTAKIGIDDNGLWYLYQHDETDPDHVRMKKKVDKKEITQSSWGFSVRSDGDNWERRDGRLIRTLTGIDKVYDVSLVTFPANPDTSVAKRSLELYEKAHTSQEDKEARKAQDEENQDTETLIEIALLERRFHQNTLK